MQDIQRYHINSSLSFSFGYNESTFHSESLFSTSVLFVLDTHLLSMVKSLHAFAHFPPFQHSFLHYLVMVEMLSWFGIYQEMPGTVKGEHSVGIVVPRRKTQAWNVAPLALVRVIWRARNRRVFKGLRWILYNNGVAFLHLGDLHSWNPFMYIR